MKTFLCNNDDWDIYWDIYPESIAITNTHIEKTLIHKHIANKCLVCSLPLTIPKPYNPVFVIRLFSTWFSSFCLNPLCPVCALPDLNSDLA